MYPVHRPFHRASWLFSTEVLDSHPAARQDLIIPQSIRCGWGDVSQAAVDPHNEVLHNLPPIASPHPSLMKRWAPLRLMRSRSRWSITSHHLHHGARSHGFGVAQPLPSWEPSRLEEGSPREVHCGQFFSFLVSQSWVHSVPSRPRFQPWSLDPPGMVHLPRFPIWVSLLLIQALHHLHARLCVCLIRPAHSHLSHECVKCRAHELLGQAISRKFGAADMMSRPATHLAVHCRSKSSCPEPQTQRAPCPNIPLTQ